MRIVLVEPTIQHLLLALRLSTKYEVILIDAYAEVGTPSFQVGMCKQPSVFDDILTQAERDFLQLGKGISGFGFRGEWLVKHLVRHCVNNGVHVYSRTTILTHEGHNKKSHLRLQSPPNLPHELEVDAVLVDASIQRKAPGNVNHTINADLSFVHSTCSTVEWHGIMLPTSHYVPSGEDLVLHRGDGCTEVWSKNDPMSNSYVMEQWTSSMSDEIEELYLEHIKQQTHHIEKALHNHLSEA